MQTNTNFKNALGEINIQIDSSRFDKKARAAQILLNTQIAADCEPYIPFDQGQLRGSVYYPNGIDQGIIEWNTPYAHYQYEGILYLAENGSSCAEKYDIKYPSDKMLEYHQPGTGSKWFESAKADEKENWINLVKKTMGEL